MNVDDKHNLKNGIKRISKQYQYAGNHWMGYHIMMREIRNYEKRYDIQIKIEAK